MPKTRVKRDEERLAVREKQALALRLRTTGATYQQIADAIGYKSPGSTRDLVKAALAEITREPAEELIEIECARLDRLLVALWQYAIGYTETRANGTTRYHPPSVEAVDRVLKIMTRRARLLGLDAPTKKEVTGEWIMRGAAEKAAEAFGLDPREVIAQAEALFKELSE